MLNRKLLSASCGMLLAVAISVPSAGATPPAGEFVSARSATSVLPHGWAAPLPAPPRLVTPDPKTASNAEVPSTYPRGCHGGVVDTTAKACVFGKPAGSKTVVLFGDSHAAQWFDGINGAAKSAGWKLVVMTKLSCPSTDVTVVTYRKRTAYSQCDPWRRSGLAQIARLKPALVVVSNFNDYAMLTRSGRSYVAGKSGIPEWKAGTTRLLNTLSKSAGRILLLRDTPALTPPASGDSAVITCITAHMSNPNAACSRSAAAALPTGRWSAEKSAAARTTKTKTLDMIVPTICTSTCTPVTSAGILKFRDRTHLTRTFSRSLAGKLKAALGL